MQMINIKKLDEEDDNDDGKWEWKEKKSRVVWQVFCSDGI